jgi:hypothetical protein
MRRSLLARRAGALRNANGRLKAGHDAVLAHSAEKWTRFSAFNDAPLQE